MEVGAAHFLELLKTKSIRDGDQALLKEFSSPKFKENEYQYLRVKKMVNGKEEEHLEPLTLKQVRPKTLFKSAKYRLVQDPTLPTIKQSASNSATMPHKNLSTMPVTRKEIEFNSATGTVRMLAQRQQHLEEIQKPRITLRKAPPPPTTSGKKAHSPPPVRKVPPSPPTKMKKTKSSIA